MNKNIELVKTETQQIQLNLNIYASQAEGAFSENTKRAITADTRLFGEWCAKLGLGALPAAPEVLAQYIDEYAVIHKPATVKRRVSSIAHLHRAAGLADPTKSNAVRLALRRMCRTSGSRSRQARPINETDVSAILATTGTRLTDQRDVALLLTARDLMARRSEVVALNVNDITPNEDGSGAVLISKSKTDQDREGTIRWLSPRTMAAIMVWLGASLMWEGKKNQPLFPALKRNGQSRGTRMAASDVARRFKIMAARAGIDTEFISGHSCRVGMAQDLVAAGAELPALMQAGRWKSAAMPARYTERLAAGRGAVALYYSKRR